MSFPRVVGLAQCSYLPVCPEMGGEVQQYLERTGQVSRDW
jgi:hypothetical protein